MSEEIWDQDDSTRGEFDNDVEIRMKHLFQDGFRTGVAKGQETSVQLGFDIGYSEALKCGKDWGECHGVLATFEAFKSKVEAPEIHSKLEVPNNQIKGISKKDAYTSIYNTLVTEKIEEFKESGGQPESSILNNHPAHLGHQVVPEYLEQSSSNENTKSKMQSIQKSIKELDS